MWQILIMLPLLLVQNLIRSWLLTLREEDGLVLHYKKWLKQDKKKRFVCKNRGEAVMNYFKNLFLLPKLNNKFLSL